MGQHFYSHALVGRDNHILHNSLGILHFYSHALVGRDINTNQKVLFFYISTHTPSWGVTKKEKNFRRMPENFYSHALVGRD